MGQRNLKMWRQTSEHRIKRMPMPLRIAISIIGGRNNLRSWEKSLLLILKRDPEVRAIVRYIMTGNAILLPEMKELQETVEAEVEKHAYEE